MPVATAATAFPRLNLADEAEDVNREAGRLLGAATGVLRARQAGEVLRGLAGSDSGTTSSVDRGLGNLLTGMGNLLGAAQKGQADMLGVLLEQTKPQKETAADTTTQVLLALLVELVKKNIGQPQQQENRYLDRLLEMLQDRVDALESRGPSPLERQLEQLLTRNVAQTMEMAMDPQKQDEYWDKLEERRQRRGARGDDYSPGRLRYEALQAEREKVRIEAATQVRVARERSHFWQRDVPAAFERGAAALGNVLGQFGGVRLAPPNPAETAAAEQEAGDLLDAAGVPG
jgi:hypothetical protein